MHVDELTIITPPLFIYLFIFAGKGKVNIATEINTSH